MIFSAGLSPAWQQILTFDSFQPGEVNRVKDAIWCASGKVINVAVAAQSLGAPVSMLTTAGGLSGEVIEQECEKLGIHAEWIRTRQATRVCTTILANGPDFPAESNSPTGQFAADPVSTTELVEETADLEAEALTLFHEFARTYANVAEITVFTGSLPRNVPPETFAQVMRHVHKKFLLDLRGPALQFCLPFAPFLIKPNRSELESTFGERLETDEKLLAAMRRMNDGGATWVVVSDGEKGVWMTSEDSAFQLLPARVKTVNPIGCGDSLAAGIAAALIENDDDVVKAVQFGMGAAANNAEMLLPARLDPDRSRELAEQVTIQELN